MKHLRDISSLVLLTILVGFAAVPVSASGSVSLSPGLDDLVTRSGSPADSLVSVVVFLEDSGLKSPGRMSFAPSQTRAARIKSISHALKTFVARNQFAVENFLHEVSDQPLTRLWIVPAYRATVPVSSLADLAAMDGVKMVIENVTVSFDEPVEVERAATTQAASVSEPLQQLKVPALWQQGLTGVGRLVCSFDTGVKYDHEALASKWRGNSVPLSEAWFSKVAPSAMPADAVGHGTHTMGIMVGSIGADTIGVAPGAEWITAGVIDQGRPLSTTIADILEAFQWALNPDGDTATTDDVPDVILNSWGIPKGLFTPCDQTFATVIENVEAAGIVTIFAAGNEGPTPMSLRNPADMSTSPLNTFSVGAVDNFNVVASFSSRGPSSCDQSAIKPEVVAPGVLIRSSWKDGAYKVLSGTSMAAPYIAGLVALMRQYNPDATVAEIKTALLSAAADLGSNGEDNDYGHGLVDASKLLDYLPVPGLPEFALNNILISDDGVASPGEQFGMQLSILNDGAPVDRVIGTLAPRATGATMIVNQAAYFFAADQTIASNFTPYTILLSDSLYHGQSMPFELYLSYDGGQYVDTLTFSIRLGYLPDGTFATHTTNQMDLTVSDFGQYGLAPGSIYNVQGDGFKVDGSNNVLYEAGVILGRNSLQLSSAVRDSLGRFHRSDFHPTEALTDPWIGNDGGVHRVAEYVDGLSPIPIPITVRQETVSYPTMDNNALVVFKVWLKNDDVETVTNLHFGLLTDFDLPGDSEALAYDQDLNMMVQTGAETPGVALVGLRNVTRFKAFDNDSGKVGFSRAGLFEIISTDGITTGSGPSADKMFIVGSGPFTLAPGDSVQVAFALVGGFSLNDIYANAATARQLFDQPTSVFGDDGGSRPTRFSLHQNYPNPFNPTTTIAFDLPVATELTLDIFNALGQKVTTLHDGYLMAGSHSIEWDATDRSGSRVASGLYFYRLTTADNSETRKMMLLK